MTWCQERLQVETIYLVSAGLRSPYRHVIPVFTFFTVPASPGWQRSIQLGTDMVYAHHPQGLDTTGAHPGPCLEILPLCVGLTQGGNTDLFKQLELQNDGKFSCPPLPRTLFLIA